MWKLLVLLTTCLTFCLEIIHAQSGPPFEVKRKLHWSELIEEINNSTEEGYVLTNAVILAEEADSTRFNWDYRNKGIAKIALTQPEIIIKKPIFFNNVYIDSYSILSRIRFKGVVHWEYVYCNADLIFSHCTFDKYFYANLIQSFKYIVTDCHFKEMFYTEKMHTTLSFRRNQVEGGLELLNYEDRKEVFDIYENTINGYGVINMSSGGSLNLYKNIWKGRAEDKKFSLYLGGESVYDHLSIYRDTFVRALFLNDLSVRESFKFKQVNAQDKIVSSTINLPLSNSNVRWPILAGYKLNVVVDTNFFDGRTEFKSNDTEGYYDLLKVYSQYQNIFKYNGDMDSYNASYIEMKKMTDRYNWYSFQQQPGINTLMVALLNSFLGWFCDYGVNPVKAILFSFLIILLFGVLYFIFPFQEETAAGGYWKGRVRRLVNATALSMNAFVTLGYGEMPAKGVQRYLAVLEGLIGWFLLSIFSASLISQMLQ